MTHLKPQIPDEFTDIIASYSGNTKLKNYSEDAIKYKSLCKYFEKYSIKKADFAQDILDNSREQLINANEMLWASKKYAVLVVLQGMDTAGKDGVISHVLSGVNPQTCNVASFKTPTIEEHEHNFLWRYSNKLPKRGETVIFNRSYYEDVLVTKVHPELMEELPDKLNFKGNKNFWNNRYEDINAFERHLSRNGTLILKFFLHISKDEQRLRLLNRLNNKGKLWKASKSDFEEREYWNKYITAYENVLSSTSTANAPWIIIPANDKQIARAIIAHSIAGAVNALKISYPKINPEDIDFLNQSRKKLTKN